MDQVTISKIALLHPKLRAEALEIYRVICTRLTGRAQVRFSWTYRTEKEQNDLFTIGRTIPGKKVTNSRAGESYHNYGLAIDIVLIIDGKKASWEDVVDFDNDGIADWSEIVSIFKQYGWKWGGDWRFKDSPHFEKTFGLSIVDLKTISKDKMGYFL